MAYAGDLKSPDAYASCGFDPHPGHQRRRRFCGCPAGRNRGFNFLSTPPIAHFFLLGAPRISAQHKNANPWNFNLGAIFPI